jgi:hypothetical protein
VVFASLLATAGLFQAAQAQAPLTPAGTGQPAAPNGQLMVTVEQIPQPAQPPHELPYGPAIGRRTLSYAGPQPGMAPLPTDLFKSKNFYKDKANWTNRLYFRCNTPRQLTDMWTNGRIGLKPPESAAWGDCTGDLPREKIVSPYAYKTAKAHYDALMAAAKAKGGPTVHTRADLPDWDGYYARDTRTEHGAEWIWGGNLQAATMVSLLTPEYQKRMVQLIYHESVTNAPQWEAAFCYPEGFMRWWAEASRGGQFQLTMSTWNVQLLSGIAGTFLRQVFVGEEPVQKVPQWYGETVGFWDGDTLVTWTSNVQPWTLSHSMFEFSGKMETVETFKPAHDAGGKFVGIDHETVFYDPEAFVQPLRANYRYLRIAKPHEPNPPGQERFYFNECLSNLKDTNGRMTQLTKGDPRYVDYYGRPWAQNWETWFEKGWDKPEESSVSADVLDLFK